MYFLNINTEAFTYSKIMNLGQNLRPSLNEHDQEDLTVNENLYNKKVTNDVKEITKQ